MNPANDQYVLSPSNLAKISELQVLREEMRKTHNVLLLGQQLQLLWILKKITLEELETLNKLVSSPDPENHLVAQETITNLMKA
jgi:hypothetical protein